MPLTDTDRREIVELVARYSLIRMRWANGLRYFRG